MFKWFFWFLYWNCYLNFRFAFVKLRMCFERKEILIISLFIYWLCFGIIIWCYLNISNSIHFHIFFNIISNFQHNFKYRIDIMQLSKRKSTCSTSLSCIRALYFCKFCCYVAFQNKIYHCESNQILLHYWYNVIQKVSITNLIKFGQVLWIKNIRAYILRQSLE